MSTNYVTANPGGGWVLFANTDEDFQCEVIELGYAEITFQDTAPTESSAFHAIRAGTLFVRGGSTGAAYVRVSEVYPTRSVTLSVST